MAQAPTSTPRERLDAFFERAATTIAAASGLATVACVSGLTQATCYAMVQTYVTAVITFSLGFLCAGASLLFTAFRALAPGAPSLFIEVTRWGFFAAAVFYFVAAGGAGEKNLSFAAKYCFTGSDADAHIHQPVELAIWPWSRAPAAGE
jgi:hypothetical protein